jgi:hypothetical protein
VTKKPRTGGRHRPGRPSAATNRHAAPRQAIGHKGTGRRRDLAARGHTGRRRDLAARGQALGFAALVLILVTVVVLAVIRQPGLAGLIVTTGLIGVVGIFVTGRFPPLTSTGAQANDEQAEPEGGQPPALP